MIINFGSLSLSLAAVFPGIFILGASYAGNNEVIVVILFTIAMGFMGTFYPGMKVNPLDLSPNYAGSLVRHTSTFRSRFSLNSKYVSVFRTCRWL